MNTNKALKILAWSAVAMTGNAAFAATWVGGSSNYANTANWDIPSVPCFEILPISNSVIINTSGITVSQNVPVCTVNDLTLGAGVTLSLPGGATYATDMLTIAGTINGVGGSFNSTTTQFNGSTAFVFASAGSQVSLLNATNSASDTRFSASSGATLEIGVDVVTSLAPANSSVSILSASGAGSTLSLTSAANVNAGFNSGLSSAQAHSISVDNGGLIDLSSATTMTGPVDDEDRLDVSVVGAGEIRLGSLANVSAGGFVGFSASSGGNLMLPALATTQDAFFFASSGGQIAASSPNWTFSSTGRPNTSSTVLSAVGSGSLLNLSGMSSLNGGFNSGLSSAQIHSVIAGTTGVIDLSGVTLITGPFDDEDHLDFVVTDTALILLDNLTDVTAGGYVAFRATDGAQHTLPALLNTQDAFFFASSGGRITASQSQWAFSSTGRPNTTSTIISATSAGTVVDLSGMASLNAGFNSGLSSTQVHSVLASSAGLVDLSGVVAITGPVDDEDHLDLVVTDTAQILLDDLTNIAAGGYVAISATDGGVHRLPSLETSQDGFFYASSGGQIFANESDWVLSSTGRPNSSSTIVSATDAGSIADLSGMTALDASFNSGLSSAQFHQVTATSAGIVDLSRVETITGPVDDEDFLSLLVTDTAVIMLDGVTDIVASGYVAINAADNGIHHLPSLERAQDGFFYASNGGQIFANESSWTFASTGRPNSSSTILSTNDSGSVADLRGMRTLNAGFNSGLSNAQTHSVLVGTQSTLDISGVTNIIGPVDSEDRLSFAVSGGATLGLGTLNNVTGGGSVALNVSDDGSVVAFPNSLDANNKMSIVVETGSTMRVTGDVRFNHTVETRFNLENGSLRVEGAEPLTVEIGGFNIGPTLPVSENFSIGQLVVGSETQTTVASLIDGVDNGNGNELCETGREALYLYGIAGGANTDGLRILNGSTLILGGLDLYTDIAGVNTHVNPLLTPGVPLAFDEGFIELGTPFDIDLDGVADGQDNCVFVANSDQSDTDGDGYGNACDADLNGDIVVNTVDLGQLRLAFFSTPGDANWNPNADFNDDQQINVIDLGIMRAAFFEPPGPACPVP